MLRKTLLFLSLALAVLGAKATHMSGGEIYWECIGTNQYRIRLIVYRDCAGINVDPSYNLVLTSPCGNRNLTVSTNGGTELSQLCDTQLPNSTCNGGTLPGIQQYIYTGTITLQPCDSWRITWTNIYRNNAIVNLTNPGTRQMFIESVLNSAAAPCNDSPTFTNSAIPYVCLGYPVSYSYGAVDPEADSLSYSLIGARMINGTPIPYVAPFTPSGPIDGLTLDPVSGQLNFTLNQAGNWVVVVLVTEYDENGNAIGSIMRDMQFVAYPCSNIPPDASTGTVTNLTGTATVTGPRSVQVCESGNFCINMVISDANAGNVLEAVSNAALNLPGATFSYTGTNPITGTLCWTAQPGTAGFYPLIINVNDGACPIPAFQTYVYSIEVITGIAATVNTVNEACAGSGDGSAAAVVTAGTAPYTYAWSNGGTGSMITAGAGNYTVSISDVNGCMSGALPAVIGASAQPNSANAGPDVTSCPGSGAIALAGTVANATAGTWSGGTGSYFGAWPNVTYAPSAAERANGQARLVLTTVGNNNCPPASDTLIIDLPNSFSGLSVGHADVTCNGGSDGSAFVVPGLSTLDHSWNDPGAQTGPQATGLSAGVYTVTIEDGFGCDTVMSVSIGQPAALALVSLDATDEDCLGSGNGTITAVVSGGTAPYAYSWSNGGSAASIVATSGTYLVSVTDAVGCAPVSGTAVIGTEGLPNGADAGDDVVVCSPGLPVALGGSVTNATGGAWSGGNGSFSGAWPNVSYTPSANDIALGSVTLTLITTGNTTCPPAFDDVVLLIPNSFQGVGITHTDATCFGSATGTASVSPVSDFTFQWQPIPQSTPTAVGLMAGTYSVLVSDAFGCDTIMTTTIDEPQALSITGMPSVNETCAGSVNGNLAASVQGGTQPYFYAWSNGATTSGITAGAGVYSVVVTDANGCSPVSASGTILATGQPNSANAGPDLVACLGSYPIELQGSVTNATGGQWSGGDGSFMGSGLQVGYVPTMAEILSGGVELILATTGNTVCPPGRDTILVTLSNSFIGASLATTDATCNGLVDGSIAFSPVLPGLLYQWSSPQVQNTPNVSGLGAGTYSVLVTDAWGCDTLLSTAILEPPVLAVSQLNVTGVSCHGGGNGAVSLGIQGGTPGYSVEWSNGQAGTGMNNLTAGTYTASITDAQGCATEAVAVVDQPGPMQVAVVAPDTVCVNMPMSFAATVTGGAGGYILNWGGMGSGQAVQLTLAQSQTIQLTVVDQAGCAGPTTPVSVTVLDLATADIGTYGDTTVCAGGVAIVGATVSGYPGSYSIEWTPFGYTGAGPYTIPVASDQDITVTLRDACGTSVVRAVALRLEIAPAIELPPVIAEGCAPLTVQFPDLDLGTVVYTWNLGNGATSNMVAPQVTYQEGNYEASLTVTTPLGCTSSSNAGGAIIAHGSPTAAFTPSTLETNIDDPTISFTDQSLGTIVGYAWAFGDGGTSSVVDPTYVYNDIGTFDVELTVVNEHGCEDVATVPITITPVYDVVIPTAFTPDPNGPGGSGGVGGGNWLTGDLSNDVFYPFVRFVKDFRMRVFNRWGELVFESTDLNIGWDGYYRGVLSPQDVYVVQSWFRFVDGRTVEKLTDLTLFR